MEETEESPINTQPPSGSSNKLLITLLILISTLSIGAAVYSFYQINQLQEQLSRLENKPSSPTSNLPPETKTSPSPNSTVVPVKSSAYYRLEIRLKSPEKEPPKEKYYFLGKYLQDALSLSKEKKFNEIISSIVYDTREGSPHDKNTSKYSFNYYLALKEGEIETPKEYEDEYTIINVSQIETDLEPYIDNSDYCKTDNDCTIRTNSCTYGSFNYYHPFVDTWGCGPPSDETGYTFRNYDENMGCITEVTYDDSKCVQNQCIGQNRKVFCREK